MKDGGGHAFPQFEAIQNEWHKDYGKDRGMTLRDYFAAKAIVECIRVAADQTPTTIREPKLSVLFDKAALFAYAVADAMLKAREA